VEGDRALIGTLRLETDFYVTPTIARADTRRRIEFLKNVSQYLFQSISRIVLQPTSIPKEADLES
jgi:hypothetical protein